MHKYTEFTIKDVRNRRKPRNKVKETSKAIYINEGASLGRMFSERRVHLAAIKLSHVTKITVLLYNTVSLYNTILCIIPSYCTLVQRPMLFNVDFCSFRCRLKWMVSLCCSLTMLFVEFYWVLERSLAKKKQFFVN